MKPSGVGSFFRRFSAAADPSGDEDGRLRFACFGTSGGVGGFLGLAAGLSSTLRFLAAGGGGAGGAFFGGGETLEVDADAEVDAEAEAEGDAVEVVAETMRRLAGRVLGFEGTATGFAGGDTDEAVSDASDDEVEEEEVDDAVVEGRRRLTGRLRGLEGPVAGCMPRELDEALLDEPDVFVGEDADCCRDEEAAVEWPDEPESWSSGSGDESGCSIRRLRLDVATSTGDGSRELAADEPVVESMMMGEVSVPACCAFSRRLDELETASSSLGVDSIVWTTAGDDVEGGTAVIFAPTCAGGDDEDPDAATASTRLGE